jgi:hypothetical protein
MTLNKYFKDIIFLASNINNLMINVMLIYPDIYIYKKKRSFGFTPVSR